MKKLNKIAAIVPALNEEANIADVLKVLLNSNYFTEVILVDDGSEDKTAEIGKSLGAKVIKLPKNIGKGGALIEGVKSTEAEIIIFFDADLVGLTHKHIASLAEPVLNGSAYMCVGIRDRAGKFPKFVTNLNFLAAIGGERALKRDSFQNIPERFLQGFGVETALNHYFYSHNFPVKYVSLDNLDIIIKEKKWGFVKGFSNRIKMIFEILRIRLIFFLKEDEFI